MEILGWHMKQVQLDCELGPKRSSESSIFWER